MGGGGGGVSGREQRKKELVGEESEGKVEERRRNRRQEVEQRQKKKWNEKWGGVLVLLWSCWAGSPCRRGNNRQNIFSEVSDACRKDREDSQCCCILFFYLFIYFIYLKMCVLLYKQKTWYTAEARLISWKLQAAALQSVALPTLLRSWKQFGNAQWKHTPRSACQSDCCLRWRWR